MIRPTATDIGKGVVYQSHPDAPKEDGTITGLGDTHIDDGHQWFGVAFVKYNDGSPNAKLTNCRDLEWLMPS